MREQELQITLSHMLFLLLMAAPFLEAACYRACASPVYSQRSSETYAAFRRMTLQFAEKSVRTGKTSLTLRTVERVAATPSQKTSPTTYNAIKGTATPMATNR
jgi:hypothetical protein